MTYIEAMKQALEALELARTCIEIDSIDIEAEQAADALRQAIAEAEKQEPVATNLADVWKDIHTHPQPKREPLTDEQIEQIFGIHNDEDEKYALHWERDLVRQIEAAHGIKE